MGRSYTLDDLQKWEARIYEKVQEFGLKCYPQEFEICDHVQMLGMMTYSGMPSHYPHWSYGKSFERLKTLYDYGVQGIPYEMVINSDPCIAGLMRDNSLCLQILTMAHVYGHNDFFRNNFTFDHTQASTVITRFKSHADRIRSYVEDPSIGQDGVERVLDAAHALSLQCRRNQAIRRLGRAEQIDRLLAEAESDRRDRVALGQKTANGPAAEHPDIHKFPLEPEENILLFIRDFNPRLTEWEKDLLTIVHEQALYFQPQIETKIINEGWACYWHREIMNSLDLPSDIHMEFLVRHNQVVRPIPGDINPYNIGLALWDRIEEKELGEARNHSEDRQTPDIRKKMFEIREVDRDTSFIRRFMDRETMERLDLFEAAPQHGDWVISKVADEENWRSVRDMLIQSVGLGGIPRIAVTDGDVDGARTLLLTHEFDGRELEAKYAEKTLEHVYQLWGRKVMLETRMNDNETTYSFDDSGLSITAEFGEAQYPSF
ncbi:SpoVR family protein [Sneathiella chinensis]|uniref:Stage V sporulation protein R n=1 Tax=Sneathiella chinensis TaxID=349750 RepID=A0ABQ5U4S1_9PROT|nr:SpoVR family protein [Sneathiella chinensis]GLQ06718.1 stage V sporulation protein R [Sneathiella chinensis]